MSVRLECKDCHHAVRLLDGEYTHSGRRGADCGCKCTNVRELGARKRREPESAPAKEQQKLPELHVVVSQPELPLDASAAGDNALQDRFDPNVMHVSNSELKTFKECRRKWWLAYYRRLRPVAEQVVGPLALGTKVHVALSAYYSTRREDPVQVIEQLYDTELSAPEMVSHIEDLEKERDLALAMIEGYLQYVAEEGLDEGLEIIADEASVAHEVVPGVVLRGKLDVRVRRQIDGARMFIDHKTVGDLKTPTRTLALDEQMLTYQLLERLQDPTQTGEYAAGGLYNMLRKVKRTARANPPFYDRIEVRHNEIELRNFWYRLVAEINDIVQVRERLGSGISHQSVVYPNPSRDCTWKCEFFAVCPMFDDGSNVDGFLEAYYTEDNPYRRYDADRSDSSGTDLG